MKTWDEHSLDFFFAHSLAVWCEVDEKKNEKLATKVFFDRFFWGKIQFESSESQFNRLCGLESDLTRSWQNDSIRKSVFDRNFSFLVVNQGLIVILKDWFSVKLGWVRVLHLIWSWPAHNFGLRYKKIVQHFRKSLKTIFQIPLKFPNKKKINFVPFDFLICSRI